MSVNRKAVVIYGSTDLWIYWDKADKLRLFYRDISHNLCAKRVQRETSSAQRYFKRSRHAGACLLSFTIGNSRIITSVSHFECINSDTHNTF